MTVSEIIERAKAEVGTKERPNNLVKYNQWFYGKDMSAPWCATFICWLFRDSGVLTKSASCTAIYNGEKAKGNVVSVNNIKEGDIIFMNFSRGKNIEHIGICIGRENSKIYTIEGNTSNGGSQSNGDSVLKKTRYIGSNVVCAIRPDYIVSCTAPVVNVKPTSTYKVGLTYTLCANLYVRTSPNGEKKPFSEFTKDGKLHGYDDGTGGLLRKGTKITCQGISIVNKQTWLKCPSGYVCAIGSKGDIYIK